MAHCSYSIAQMQGAESTSLPENGANLSSPELALMATLMGLMVGLLLRAKPSG